MKMENNFSERLAEVIKSCFYEEELKEAPPDAIIVEGLTMKFGFDPKRIADRKEEIESLMTAIIPDTFYTDGGGGWSFLNLCEDKEGNQWGDHRSMEILYVLAAAIGKARFCLPREFWGILPGGVPYIQFERPGSSVRPENGGTT